MSSVRSNLNTTELEALRVAKFLAAQHLRMGGDSALDEGDQPVNVAAVGDREIHPVPLALVLVGPVDEGFDDELLVGHDHVLALEGFERRRPQRELTHGTGTTPVERDSQFDPDWIPEPTAEGRRTLYEGEIRRNDALLPALLAKLDDLHFASRDLSSLQWIAHTAAPCPGWAKQRLIDTLGPIITEFYGNFYCSSGFTCNDVSCILLKHLTHICNFLCIW